jgi:hypothetical protein
MGAPPARKQDCRPAAVLTEETRRPVRAEHSERNRAAGIDAGDEISSRQPRIAPGMPHMSVDARERLSDWDQRVPGRNRAG